MEVWKVLEEGLRRQRWQRWQRNSEKAYSRVAAVFKLVCEHFKFQESLEGKLQMLFNVGSITMIPLPSKARLEKL